MLFLPLLLTSIFNFSFRLRNGRLFGHERDVAEQLAVVDDVERRKIRRRRRRHLRQGRRARRNS